MAKDEPDGTNTNEPQPGMTNGFEPAKIKDLMSELEDLQEEIDEIMQAAKDKCAPLREQRNAIFKTAADDGIPRAELRAVEQRRRDLRKAEARREKLSEEQQDNFDLLLHALGDLAESRLGQAALSKLKGTDQASNEDAYQRGYDSGANGKTYENPFAEGTENHESFRAGHVNAQQKLVEKGIGKKPPVHVAPLA